MSKEDFIQLMTCDLPPVPAYFSADAEINRRGAQSLSELPEVKTLSPEAVKSQQTAGAIVLDVRAAGEFGTGHVPNSINIGLAGQFAPWAGSLLKFTAPIIIVASDTAQVNEAVTRLARVGIESVAGYLDGGIWAWHQAGYEIKQIGQITVAELKKRLDEKAELQLVDVRRPAEYAAGHAPTAQNIELSELENRFAELDAGRPTAVICGSGYRSSAATSLLESRGFAEIYNVTGGTTAYLNANFPIE